MMKFVHTDAFRSLNVGFSLDEGVASPTETFDVFYAERSVWSKFRLIEGGKGRNEKAEKKICPQDFILSATEPLAMDRCC